MVKETNQSVWLAAALILVVLVAGLFIVNGNMKNSIESEFSNFEVPVAPTAQEIANLIVVPVAEVPEYEVPVFESDNKVDDLWKDLYSVEIAELELNAEENATTELEILIEEAEDDSDGDFYDFLKANIEGFNELKNVYFDSEDVEVTIVELGLEENEDKVASVVFELDVRYNLEEGQVTRYKEKVIATANVVFEEGDFGDEEVNLVFAF